jgi:hypothetical protein
MLLIPKEDIEATEEAIEETEETEVDTEAIEQEEVVAEATEEEVITEEEAINSILFICHRILIKPKEVHIDSEERHFSPKDRSKC